MTAPETDMLMLGHFAKDLLVIDGPGEISSGGGIYYGSIAVRRELLDRYGQTWHAAQVRNADKKDKQTP